MLDMFFVSCGGGAIPDTSSDKLVRPDAMVLIFLFTPNEDVLRLWLIPIAVELKFLLIPLPIELRLLIAPLSLVPNGVRIEFMLVATDGPTASMFLFIVLKAPEVTNCTSRITINNAMIANGAMS